MSAVLLNELQQVLVRLADAPVEHRVAEFHIGNRETCSLLMRRELQLHEDEQVLVSDEPDGLSVSVYVDDQVLERLDEHNPLRALDEHNFADFCTAIEGVSHFHYLVWCTQRQRQVSLLELELQAEVDKYAAASYLLREQGQCDLPGGLCRQLFDAVSYMAGLHADSARRYQDANRFAASYCRRINQHLSQRRFRPELWLRQLRSFYRLSQLDKVRQALA